jgi:SdpC family antimicrobial peptide
MDLTNNAGELAMLLTKRFVALALVALIGAFYPASAFAGRGPASRPTETLDFSGEELVNGLLLGRGPVVERFPQLSPMSLVTAVVPPPDAEMSRVLDALIVQMAQLDPTFFERFREAVTSGDHYSIRAAIDEGGDRVWSAIGDLAQTDREAGAVLAASALAQRQPSEAHADAVLVALVAVLIVLAIVVVFYQDEPESELAVEMWTDRIATTLG